MPKVNKICNDTLPLPGVANDKSQLPCRSCFADRFRAFSSLVELTDMSLSPSWTPARVLEDLASMHQLARVQIDGYRPRMLSPDLAEFGALPALTSLRLSFGPEACELHVPVSPALSQLRELRLGDFLTSDVMSVSKCPCGTPLRPFKEILSSASHSPMRHQFQVCCVGLAAAAD